MRAGPASYADVEGRPSEYGEVAKAPPYQISFIVLSSCLLGLMEIYIGTNTKP